MTPPKTFTCATCKGTFLSGWTEEEAVAEAQRLWGAPADVAADPGYEQVCDNCFRMMTAVYPPEQFMADQRARAN